jgi:ABC-type branched-subunit amino acid transport system ATPase component/branched-subunit amino acid ABC-type transport system permease component
VTELLQFVLLGMATGAVYALTAQGLVVVYRGSGVVNFAQGAFGVVGAFLFYEARANQVPTAAAWALAVLAPALLGAATHLVVMARLSRASPLVRLVATLGMLFLLVSVANQIWTADSAFVRSPLPSTLRHPFSPSITIGEDRLWLVGIAVVITAVLSIIYGRTRFGHATEAVSENPSAASALGISPNVIAAVNWAVGGALASLAGILIAPILLLQTTALSFVVLRALAAALVGRFTSFWSTLAGALGIGIVESVLSRYIAHEGVFEPITSTDGFLLGQFSAQAVSRSTAFLIIVVVLVVGGRSLPLRSEILDRLPSIGSGQVHGPAVALAVGAAICAILLVPSVWATAFIVTLATAVIMLSLVVVTGYVGQLSLAQLALAGFGAWVAGRLVDGFGWPFPLALLAGVLLTVPVGLLVAVPALRTRGVSLAVLTFGVSVVIVELVLANPKLTGGLSGTSVRDIQFFTVELDAYSSPEVYALFTLAAFVLLALGLANLRRGGAGRSLIAVRDNERAAASLGISVSGAKMFAFGLGSAIAAVGGILLAFRQHTLAFTQFGAIGSVQIVVFAVIGGIGYLAGPLVGGLLVGGGLASRVGAEAGFGGAALDVASAVLLILTLLANPNGVVGAAVGAQRRLRRSAGRRRPSIPSEQSGDGQPPPTIRVNPRALAVTGLGVRFGGVVAVDEVSLRVEPGTVVGLIGPNGAGKTTLIDAVTGFVRSTGTVELGNDDVSAWTAKRRARAGLSRSFQTLELFEDLTVEENINVACDRVTPWSYARDLVRPRRLSLPPAAASIVTEFGLEEDLHRTPSELPYGRRRLVAIARATSSLPSVLLLDEPAAGLSESETRSLGVLIRHLAAEWGIGVLLVEHDMSLVMDVCDHLVVIEFGQKIAQGPPAAVSREPAVVAAYLGEHAPAAEPVAQPEG